MSPLYLPICGIYLPFQVNLYVPNSKPTNEILFCMLEQLMYQLGLSISSMYLLFQTLLPLFWTLTCMIRMELTRTDVVFSRTTMVLFLCRNKSSRNDLKFNGDLF